VPGLPRDSLKLVAPPLTAGHPVADGLLPVPGALPEDLEVCSLLELEAVWQHIAEGDHADSPLYGGGYGIRHLTVDPDLLVLSRPAHLHLPRLADDDAEGDEDDGEEAEDDEDEVPQEHAHDYEGDTTHYELLGVPVQHLGLSP